MKESKASFLSSDVEQPRNTTAADEEELKKTVWKTQTVREIILAAASKRSLTGECEYVADRQAAQMWVLRSALLVLFHFYESKGFKDEDSLLPG